MTTELKAALVDLGHKSAFDLLLKEAWNPEIAALGNSTLAARVVRDQVGRIIRIYEQNILNRDVVVSVSRKLGANLLGSLNSLSNASCLES